jgi:hypothetical protein
MLERHNGELTAHEFVTVDRTALITAKRLAPSKTPAALEYDVPLLPAATRREPLKSRALIVA